MAFESLGEKLQGIFKKLKGQGKISDKDLKAALREVRVALLEADVNYKVVKDFVNTINERALGQDVLESLTPGQQVIKIVNDELTQLMGGAQSKLEISPKPPTVIMMIGLQGSGKTTSTGKLGRFLKKQGRSPLLVACDIYRPAAIKQLQVLGEQLEIPVFSMGDKTSPVDIAKAALNHATYHGNDLVLLDTAGRLHIDEALMAELSAIKNEVKPTEILLVVDAMTGQDAVNVAEKFNELLNLTGVVLTKLDGDTRGGAALSVKAVTGKPIKFVGMGEKLDALEPFHPERMASRILGMGDVLTLIEKAQENFDSKQAQELQQKLLKAEFTLEDFLTQMQQMKNMGPLDQVMDMIPGMNKAKLKGLEFDEKEFVRFQAVIQSMTKDERRNPHKINGSRRKRIALGSGTKVQDVNRLLKQFEQAQKMMKQLSGMASGKGKKGKLKLPFM
ncbi:MAG: signal recognition particle [Peptococcaceae bacterium BICA1-8]|nr:MAG: signal recognition particle [Peptococcaceae bacterium BICA1-8]